MIDVIQLTDHIEVAHIGPSLEKGRLPAVFYFSISGQDSLGLDPFNQPAIFLAEKGLRVFSMDLPAHGPNLNPLEAIAVWEQEFSEGQDPLAPFLDKALFAINALFDKGLIFKEKLGLMGLSRGGLIACLLATKLPEVRAIVGFAPMTQFSAAKQYNLENYIDALCEQKIRFYISNRDTRVGTDKCFNLVQSLAEGAFQKGVRSPQIEMIISPPIGHMGHGTSKETFHEGALWLGKQLGVH